MWKIGVFLIVISIAVMAGEVKAQGYCVGVGLNCIPVLYGHLLSTAGQLVTWGDGDQVTWGDGEEISWSN